MLVEHVAFTEKSGTFHRFVGNLCVDALAAGTTHTGPVTRWPHPLAGGGIQSDVQVNGPRH